jgi:tetratricopeptide (TPR) repeat protein
VVSAPEEEPRVAEEVALPVVGAPEEEPRVAEEVALPAVEEPEEVPPVAEEVALPVVEEREEELPVPEAAAEEEVAPPSRADELVEQLKTRPRDTKLRLELARLYAGEQDWDDAFAQYGKLISARKQLPEVIQDLEPLEQKEVDRVQLYQLLGDAYMHQDQLDKALQMYRQARQSLARH